ncbi:MAG: hypothetical protein R2865_10525, partial [Deinococcales bacterium]
NSQSQPLATQAVQQVQAQPVQTSGQPLATQAVQGQLIAVTPSMTGSMASNAGQIVAVTPSSGASSGSNNALIGVVPSNPNANQAAPVNTVASPVASLGSTNYLLNLNGTSSQMSERFTANRPWQLSLSGQATVYLYNADTQQSLRVLEPNQLNNEVGNFSLYIIPGQGSWSVSVWTN